MKGEKIRVIIIYFLVLVIIGLVGYLIYFIYDQNNNLKSKDSDSKVDADTEEITDACTFDVTLAEFNEIYDNTVALELCTGYSKLNISDIVLNDNPIDVYAIYYNKSDEEVIKSGIYMNDNQITSGLTLDNKNKTVINDNMLFIKVENILGNNLVVFDESGNQVYDLSSTLASLKFEDPVLAELAKTNENINPTLSIDIVDKDSYNFTSGAFTFNTIYLDTKQKGSTYTVTYNDSKFENPVIK